MRLREFTLGDIAAIADIRNASVSISPDFFAMTVDRFRCDFYGETHPAHARITVIENDASDVIGFYHLYSDAHLLAAGRADLDSLHVRPDARGSGAGARLVEDACQAARAWGARYVSIAIPESSTRSLVFLSRQGFTPVCTFEKTRVDLREASLSAPQLPKNQTIRHFQVGKDEAAFVQVFNQCFAELWNFSELTLEELTDWNHRANFDPAGCFLLYEADDLIGFSTLLQTEEGVGEQQVPIGRIFELGVLPQRRRSGSGLALLNQALCYASQRGLQVVDLVTEANQGGGRYLFQKLGANQTRRTVVLHRTTNLECD